MCLSSSQIDFTPTTSHIYSFLILPDLTSTLFLGDGNVILNFLVIKHCLFVLIPNEFHNPLHVVQQTFVRKLPSTIKAVDHLVMNIYFFSVDIKHLGRLYMIGYRYTKN
jgi:hypothetical protein